MKANMKERVFSAADALLAEGNDNPSNAEVRESLGSGSLSHISPLMNEWRKIRLESELKINAVPEELKLLADSTLNQAWSMANKIAQKAMDGFRQESKGLLEIEKRDKLEALQEIATLEAKILEIENSLSTATSAKTSAETRLNTCNVDNAKLKETNRHLNATLEQIRSENTILKEKNEKLYGEFLNIAKKASNHI